MRQYQENKHFNLNNQNNNNIDTRGIQGHPTYIGGARAKVSTSRINNSGVRNQNRPGTASSTPLQGQNKDKTNNRVMQGILFL